MSAAVEGALPPGAELRRRPHRRSAAALQARGGARVRLGTHPPPCACDAIRRAVRRPTAWAGLSYSLDSSRRSRVVTIASFYYGPRLIVCLLHQNPGNLMRNGGAQETEAIHIRGRTARHAQHRREQGKLFQSQSLSRGQNPPSRRSQWQQAHSSRKEPQRAGEGLFVLAAVLSLSATGAGQFRSRMIAGVGVEPLFQGVSGQQEEAFSSSWPNPTN